MELLVKNPAHCAAVAMEENRIPDGIMGASFRPKDRDQKRSTRVGHEDLILDPCQTSGQWFPFTFSSTTEDRGKRTSEGIQKGLIESCALGGEPFFFDYRVKRKSNGDIDEKKSDKFLFTRGQGFKELDSCIVLEHSYKQWDKLNELINKEEREGDIFRYTEPPVAVQFKYSKGCNVREGEIASLTFGAGCEDLTGNAECEYGGVGF
jgi:hypothetical protein